MKSDHGCALPADDADAIVTARPLGTNVHEGTLANSSDSNTTKNLGNVRVSVTRDIKTSDTKIDDPACREMLAGEMHEVESENSFKSVGSSLPPGSRLATGVIVGREAPAQNNVPYRASNGVRSGSPSRTHGRIVSTRVSKENRQLKCETLYKCGKISAYFRAVCWSLLMSTRRYRNDATVADCISRFQASMNDYAHANGFSNFVRRSTCDSA